MHGHLRMQSWVLGAKSIIQIKKMHKYRSPDAQKFWAQVSRKLESEWWNWRGLGEIREAVGQNRHRDTDHVLQGGELTT